MKTKTAIDNSDLHNPLDYEMQRVSFLNKIT